MLLVVCPNLAVDRIIEVPGFQPTRVQRSRSVIVQPGGKGSNVARVFRQLGGEVVLVGFVGRTNRAFITEPLRRSGIHVDAISAFDGESRTCTIICDPDSKQHATVINEESPVIEPGCEAKLLKKIESWIPRARAVLTTGSLSMGLSDHLYAEILDRARWKGKQTAIDAAGPALRFGLLARPEFVKPNLTEFRALTGADGSRFVVLPPHTALTLGKAGAVLIRPDKWLYASSPRISEINPIGAGDAFTAAYLSHLLDGGSIADCLRFALAAAASDAASVRPGLIQPTEVESLAKTVELRFQSLTG